MDQTQYAKQIGPRILEFFETYFNVKFPLPKQDMIAIPDFGAGAMENWGLITYRWAKIILQVNNSGTKYSSISEKQLYCSRKGSPMQITRRE